MQTWPREWNPPSICPIEECFDGNDRQEPNHYRERMNQGSGSLFDRIFGHPEAMQVDGLSSTHGYDRSGCEGGRMTGHTCTAPPRQLPLPPGRSVCRCVSPWGRTLAVWPSGTGGTACTQLSTKRRFQAVGRVSPVPAVPPADPAPHSCAPLLVFRTTSDATHQSNQTDIDRVMVFQKLWIPRDVRLTAQAALAES